ncbi:MAG: hypothetical protein HZB64_00130 [Rhodocyclales bacterium]|nr:hypothetical protein [Rhodocyclales bacterium]
MKHVLRISGAVLAVLMILFALPARAQMMIGHMFHGHGNCVIETGTYPVEFAAYPLPGPGENPNAEVHPHCDHIPKSGQVRLLVDLVKPEEREMPLTLRLVKMEGSTEKELLSVPEKIYATGFAAIETALEQEGQYALLLDFAKTASTAEGHIRIPLHVGDRDGDHGVPWLKIGAGILLLLAAGGGAWYWLDRRPAGKV